MATTNPHQRLRHHVTGAIERGEAQAITEARAPQVTQPPATPPGLVFDEADTAIILAALRLIQRHGVPADLEDIATNGGKFDALDNDEIDALCELINI